MTNKRADHLNGLGMVAYRSHFYDAAADRFNKVVEWSPDDWNARLFLGMSHLKNKSYRNAQSAFIYIGLHCPNDDMQQMAWGLSEFAINRCPAKTKLIGWMH